MAFADAGSFAVASATTTSTGDEALNGWTCDPSSAVPGADLDAAFASIPFDEPINLRGCDLRNTTWISMTPVSALLDYADSGGANLDGLVLRIGFDEWGSITIYQASMEGTRITGASLNGTSMGTDQALATDPDSAIYAATTCPDGAVTNGTTVPTCVGHGLSA